MRAPLARIFSRIVMVAMRLSNLLSTMSVLEQLKLSI